MIVIVLRKRNIRCNNNRVLSRQEVVARSNVKHVALSNPNDHNRSNSNNHHAASRSRSSVGSSRRKASVLRLQHGLRRRLGLNRRPNRHTSVHRKRRSSHSRNSRSVVIPVIPVRAKAKNRNRR